VRPGARGSGATRRLFFAIWPDTAARAQLRQVSARWLAQVPGRALAPADWHVTLCFLGAVPASLLEPLRAGAAQVRAEAFSLTLAQLGYWPEARVLAASVAHTPAATAQLAEALRGAARALGLQPDDQALRPHLTLMRGVSPARWQQARAALAEERVALDVALPVREFTLTESLPAPPAAAGADPWASGAARYALLARWPLRG